MSLITYITKLFAITEWDRVNLQSRNQRFLNELGKLYLRNKRLSNKTDNSDGELVAPNNPLNGSYM